MKERILSGIQPTGQLHIGNYLGAIKNWVAMQNDYDCLYCIVDFHAMTIAYHPEELKKNVRSTTAAYLASGLDPKKCHIFNQGQLMHHPTLSWILGCVTPLGWLNRMTQFKDKAGKHKEQAVLGLYSYPVLQAADILLYQADHVPVGEDQKQHIELARDIATAFNSRFNVEFFKMPEPQILGAATRVMSLRDGTKKMSKSDSSDYSRIHLNDDEELIRLKIKKAKTDPDPLPANAADLQSRPEALNLVTLYAAFTDQSVDEVCKQFEGANFSVFKPKLAEIIIEALTPIRKEMEKLLADINYLDSILSQGRDYAYTLASQTLDEVYDIVGLLKTA